MTAQPRSDDVHEVAKSLDSDEHSLGASSSSPAIVDSSTPTVVAEFGPRDTVDMEIHQGRWVVRCQRCDLWRLFPKRPDGQPDTDKSPLKSAAEFKLGTSGVMVWVVDLTAAPQFESGEEMNRFFRWIDGAEIVSTIRSREYIDEWKRVAHLADYFGFSSKLDEAVKTILVYSKPVVSGGGVLGTWMTATECLELGRRYNNKPLQQASVHRLAVNPAEFKPELGATLAPLLVDGLHKQWTQWDRLRRTYDQYVVIQNEPGHGTVMRNGEKYTVKVPPHSLLEVIGQLLHPIEDTGNKERGL